MLGFTFFRTPEDAMQSAWTEADAQQKGQAGMKLNQIAHLLEHSESPTQRKILEEELKATQVKYDQIAQRFNLIQSRQEKIHAILRWTSLALILLGGILYWQQRDE